MTLRCRLSGALIALGLLASACGGAADRSAPPQRAPVTDAEERVIRGWSEEMRHGDIKAAAKYFSVPSTSVGVPPGGAELASLRQVEDFNDAFPCGARLLRVERTAHHLILADFELTSRPGADCGKSTGTRARFAFLIDADDHIARFILVDDQAAPIPTGPLILT